MKEPALSMSLTRHWITGPGSRRNSRKEVTRGRSFLRCAGSAIISVVAGVLL